MTCSATPTSGPVPQKTKQTSRGGCDRACGRGGSARSRPGAATGATDPGGIRIGEPFARVILGVLARVVLYRNPHQERGMKRPIVLLALVALLAACGDQGGGQSGSPVGSSGESAGAGSASTKRRRPAPRRSHRSPNWISALSDLGDHKAKWRRRSRAASRWPTGLPAPSRSSTSDQSEHRRAAAQHRLRRSVAGRLADLQGAGVVLIHCRRHKDARRSGSQEHPERPTPYTLCPTQLKHPLGSLPLRHLHGHTKRDLALTAWLEEERAFQMFLKWPASVNFVMSHSRTVDANTPSGCADANRNRLAAAVAVTARAPVEPGLSR